MATIKFFIKDKRDPSTIHVRFWNGRKFDFKRSTPYVVSPKYWDAKKEKIRNVVDAQNKDKINSKLHGLRTFINDTYLDDYAKGTIITGQWLESTINKFFKQAEETDLNLFTKYGDHFVDELPNRFNNATGKKGVSDETINKYKSIINKVKKFEQHKGSKVYISDINLQFQKDYIQFLSNVEQLGENTIGRQIIFIKTICKDAKANGIKTHLEFEKVKGFRKKVDFIYLNEKEIKLIAQHEFSPSSYLDNARDWFIVGLYTGQRVSDFLKLTSENLVNEMIELTQQKTGAEVIIPVHPCINKVIQKYNGEFPRHISDQKFNEYIKEVCDKAGIVQLIEGAKMNPESRRKEQGTFPKFKLVSSHICRRSFATNHYGRLPTPVIMGITGHTTEKMFLTYIGKTSKDHAEALKEYWKEEN